MRIAPVIAFSFLVLSGCSGRDEPRLGQSLAPDEPWFNPPGGTWVPDSADVSNMKDALDADLRPVLAAKAGETGPATRYWFQYLGQGSGASRTIEIWGRPFPVPSGVDTNFSGPIIPEDCHVFGSYVPSERKIRVNVAGFNCPPRI